MPAQLPASAILHLIKLLEDGAILMETWNLKRLNKAKDGEFETP
jgi:hypothetical protein